ncbi:RND transporter, Hydrophobe/Amphiphile Efflux-1 (HAE1)/Heavy Metal Efflux (HME) family, permease protein [Leptospira ryugenii]|uniref:RND transporter, Hydrophobe/Amphiphile Efflux-1 (HAE1)/Heavy Metal Efflux (HME) family, permease protein n=1 Tax=Leptospira ryugenii TaxID=1917863 RepID=A0A2P2DYH8_9LEPT|nr:efflux RND transporter permease subunit [Leptospira ryugenii]GBF49677.1 RND transporter, Hydrophobe/Amphiphile Efflux-1 (HAE1)/Heavy Metal Efflux (HME) family, permease protein [Leptospira ryugenii]
MNLANFVLNRKNLILTISISLFFLGILEFFVVPREEDPRLKERVGVLRLIYPGASIESMRKLVAKPTEEALVEIPEISVLELRIRPEVCLVEIRLNEDLGSEQEINEAWKRVEDVLKTKESVFPRGMFPWDLNRRVLDQEAILISLTGSEDPILLKDTLETLRTELLQLPQVAKINRLADPEEEVEIFIPKSRLDAKGIGLRFLNDWMRAANHEIPPGTFALSGKKTIIETDSWFRNIESIEDLIIPLASGEIVKVSDIATVRRIPKKPQTEWMRLNGTLSVGISIVAKKNIDLIKFGEKVNAVVSQWQKRHPDLKLTVINSQPKYVKDRLQELGVNLLSGILIVALVLVGMMGLRLGLLSAFIVPMIAIISLGIYGLFGGVLHQISIAAFVMALGLLIDNVIVVLESIQEKIDGGIALADALTQTISDLAFPLLSATGTTLASFIPLLGSKGNSSDFTRAIPIINMLTLFVSFVFAILVTPILAEKFLKPKRTEKADPFLKLSESVGKQVIKHYRFFLLVAGISFLVAMSGFPLIPKKFFPDADRDQLLVDIRLPEGTDVTRTNEIAKKVESWIQGDKRVKNETVFVGRTLPLFYYNLNQSPNSPHIAQILINMKNKKEKESFKAELQKKIDTEISEGYVILLELKQGPPIKAPIELRFYANEFEDLVSTNQLVLQELTKISGLKEIRSDLSIGTPKVNWQADDASLSRFRSNRSDLSLSILSQTRGVPVGKYQAGDRAIPLVIRTMEPGDLSIESISQSTLFSTRTEPIKLSSLSQTSLEWEPSYLFRRNLKTGFTILAELGPGLSVDAIVPKISGRIESLSLPNSIKWEFGGDQAESSEANQSLLAVAPLGMMLLISFLLFEFGSWKKVGIILITVPLSLIGVVPGLLITGQSFGFLSLLGIFALVGIVVNNGILLLDYVGSSQREGKSLESSVQFAIQKRIRPILLTSMTTVAGLLPLAFSEATLWPPFAWTMISGLLVSTLLTLVVVPSAILLILGKKNESTKIKKKFLGFIALFLAFPLSISAETVLDWKDVLRIAEESPRVKLAWEEWRRKHFETEKLNRAVYYPKLGLSVEHVDRNKTLFPNASLPIVNGLNQSYWTGGVEIQQTLFDPANWFAVSKALEYSEDASKLLSFRAKETSQSESLLAYISIQRIQKKIANLKDLQKTLNQRMVELKRLYLLGQVTEGELFRIEQAINQTKIAIEDLTEKQKIATLYLKRLLGLEEQISLGGLPDINDLKFQVNENDLEPRLELRALHKKMFALEEQKKSIEYEAYPKLVAKGGYFYLGTQQFNTNDWAQISLGVSVNPFDGGVRKTRSDELDSQMISVREEIKDLIRALVLEKEDSKSQIKVKETELEIRSSNVNKSRYASRKEYERMKSGRVNINTWIDAEVMYTEEKDKFDMCQFDLLENWVRYRNVLGIAYTVNP